MASVASLVRNVNLYIDGNQFAGQIASVTPPDLAINIDEYRGGGMDMPVPVDRGMEMMTSELVMRSYDAEYLRTWGLRNHSTVEFVLKAALENYDGAVVPVIFTMRGRVTNITRSPFEGQGEVPEITLMLGLTYYKEEIDGNAEIEIDALNFKRIVNGVDHLQAVRDAVA